MNGHAAGEVGEGPVIDRLAALFTECRQRGITIPDDMPLDTAQHRAAAVSYLSRLVFMDKRRPGGQP